MNIEAGGPRILDDRHRKRRHQRCLTKEIPLAKIIATNISEKALDFATENPPAMGSRTVIPLHSRGIFFLR